MGCRVITGVDETDGEVEVLYCSTSGKAFGPIFRPTWSDESAEGFLEWLKTRPGWDDPRILFNRGGLDEAVDEYRASLEPNED